MDFIHTPYQPGDTIAAIATPLGEGGVAIIRISGTMALDIAKTVFSRPDINFKSHTAYYGKILNHQKEHVDDVLLLPMLGKRSFTGEDTVEIHCHGGSLITRRVLETVLQAGARAAKPGEFSFKAFMNGKIDLCQAESIQSLISAKNEFALNAAEEQLKGNLSKRIISFQEKITLITAILEAWVDFPEEGLEFATMEELSENLQHVIDEMQQLISSFHDGKIIQEGLAVCLVGCPNAGKSSLMNALLDKDRAIVSHIPGTTRDVLEDFLRLNGLNLRLIDTAGIRESEEIIEQEGIKRSKNVMLTADLILVVLDASIPMGQDEETLLNSLPAKKTIIVWNKIDLPHSIPPVPFPHVVKISAKEKVGLEALHQEINSVIWEKGIPEKDEILITNVRHKEALDKAIQSCTICLEGLKEKKSPELLTMDIKDSLTHLGKIIGTNVTEDVLSAIFSTFCIGK